MSRLSERSSSAASMIRRFREGKPTSKQERMEARAGDNSLGENEMWWVAKDLGGTEEVEEPRLPPRAAIKPARISHNEILEKLRKPTDYMTLAASNNYKPDRSLNVDELIEREIRGSFTGLLYQITKHFHPR